MKNLRHRYTPLLVCFALLCSLLTFAGVSSSQTPIHPIATLPLNLASTSQTTGILPLSRGGTGNTTGSFSLTTQATGILPLANGGSGNTTNTINLGTQVTGTLLAGNGGTGLASPGTSGNVLTSNGSAWVSSAPLGSPTTTTVLNNVSSGGGTSPSAWSASYTATGGKCLIHFVATAVTSTFENVTDNLKIDGSVVSSRTVRFNDGRHQSIPHGLWPVTLSAGSHTLAVTISTGGTATTDNNDFASIVVEQF